MEGEARTLPPRALSLEDPDYPIRLRDLARPPAILHIAGPWDHPGPLVAIVGSRNASPEGIDLAQRLAADLTREGVAIVSGLARGIDAAAHVGALEAGGRSGAALGTPLDRCYPPNHRPLQDSLARSLGLLSELPPGAHASRASFASRNRLLAAIAHAVVLVQGDMSSGALLTVAAAERLGRPVGALPWDLDEPLAAAPHSLIRERRAELIRNAADVLALIESARPAPSAGSCARRASPSARKGSGRPESATILDRVVTPPVPATEVEARVWAGLRRRAEPLDVVASRASLSVSEVSAALLALELSGLARREPGGRYRRTRSV